MRAGAVARLAVPDAGLSEALGKLIADDKSRTNFAVRELEDPERRRRAAEDFGRISAHMGDGEGAYAAAAEAVAKAFPPELSASYGRDALAANAEALAKEDPELFGIRDAVSPSQRAKLESYAKSMGSSVKAALLAGLQDVGSSVDARAKDADGLVDKVSRMMAGNAGRQGRPEYRLADVPDAVGARVVCEGIPEVVDACRKIGSRYEVVEMKNMFTDPACADLPQKCVTFVVRVGGRLAEIQVGTRAGQLAAAAEHGASYKPRPGMSSDDASSAKAATRAALIADAEKLVPAKK